MKNQDIPGLISSRSMALGKSLNHRSSSVFINKVQLNQQIQGPHGHMAMAAVWVPNNVEVLWRTLAGKNSRGPTFQGRLTQNSP